MASYGLKEARFSYGLGSIFLIVLYKAIRRAEVL